MAQRRERKRLTVNDLEGIKIRLDAGDQLKKIAEDFDRQVSVITRVRSKIKQGKFLDEVAKAQQRESTAKIVPGAKKTWFALSTKERLKTVLKLKAKGFSALAIAKKYGIKPGNISYHFYGQYPSQGSKRVKPDKNVFANRTGSASKITATADKQYAKTIELRSQGLSIADIAKKVGVSTGAVGYYLYKRKPQGKEQANGSASGSATTNGTGTAQENLLIGFAYAETERFIGLLSERLRISTEILRPRLSKLLGHSPLRG